MHYAVDKAGYYGQFGGAYIPEVLWANIQGLTDCFESCRSDRTFVERYKQLLRDYVGRPTPLYFASRLSEHYQTNIYLKREDLNHTGSHKINNTIGQMLIAQAMNKHHIIAETGAGQHGVATATVCALMGLRCTIFMGETDVIRQSSNVARMRLLGAEVVPVSSGNKTLKDACNEALRYWIAHPEDTHYIIGSVVGPAPYPEMVRFFQQIISDEMADQIAIMTGRTYPDAVIACVGGGSNAAGAFSRFVDIPEVQLIGVEASGHGLDTAEHAASIAKGSDGIIHGSKTLLLQTEDGQIIEPYSISAGLDYPGIGPLHAHLKVTGRAQYMDATDSEALQAAYQLMQMEGIIPALESAHALAVLPKLTFRQDKSVIVCLSGRGDKDLDVYIQHNCVDKTNDFKLN